MSAWEERVQKQAAYLDSLVDLIPNQLYSAAVEAEPFSRAKLAPKVKLERKRNKLDPDTVQTVTAKQQRRLLEQQKQQHHETQISTANGGSSASAGIQELRSRLAERISALQARRLPQTRSDGSIVTDKPGKSSAQRPQQKHPSAKTRQEMIEERKRKQQLALVRQSSQSQRNRKEFVAADQSTNEIVIAGGSKDSNAESLAFSRVEFDAVPSSKRQKLDPKAALQRLEAKKKKLESVKQQDDDKAELLEEREKWHQAMSLAAGQKVQDNAKLLKKALKKREKQKEKSKKLWEERVDQVEKKQLERQAKRQENLSKRKENIKKLKGKKKAGFR